ncbi:AtMMH-1 [Punctularia strigosozonata HHB-11173 SS5]|uniref:AtMMH-1 n=1 Tax=Punctularia strigosozonata (strain HHB-11173) TaxID=741275 RepID=UPI000441656E|nr:AtMMH-1 [Punctularia strigosozonata HHB-11173 SS5]EIN13470.1 AtMMH-1 [Punctularia strigosozonata HHB-11173 SS5]
MPELPEVENARRVLEAVGKGKMIQRVDSVKDDIVFCGTTHDEFAKELEGRMITGVQRYGKLFYMELDGEGRFPVLHFGMTGMIQIQGQEPFHYQSSSRKVSAQWPPNFLKFVLHLGTPDGEQIAVQVAFCDARRLGRIRLVSSPMTSPPISELGFDPILSMPALSEFSSKVLRRSCPIKALLLDQGFSAGVGNWVADEILYHSRIHPEQRCHTLSELQLERLHTHTRQVCRVAVDADADHTKFPADWLFIHRWGKGKKTGAKSSLKLPSGDPATIKWVTVGGRTSAYVAELQQLPCELDNIEDNQGESDLTPLSEDELFSVTSTWKPRKSRKRNPEDSTQRTARKR